MLSGGIGIASPGQFCLADIAGLQSSLPAVACPAPFNRTFVVPQDGLPWQGSKAPAEIQNFSFDWSNDICCESIISSVWGVESSDIAIAASAINGGKTTALISGGVAQNIYNVTNTITTYSGIQLSATFELLVTAYNF